VEYEDEIAEKMWT